MEIDPGTLAAPERYKLLIGGIVPRPIAVVSTVSREGKANVAPFSFYAGVGSEPMTLLFCPANRPDGGDKDTLRNCLPEEEGGVGEFVVNVASESWTRQMAATAEPLAYGESEFELAGLHEEKSSVVKPPRVREALMAFECVTWQVIRTNRGVPAGGNIVLGRVVHVYVRDEIINTRHHIDPAELKAVGRMGGLGYCTTRDRFEMPMGRKALEG